MVSTWLGDHSGVEVDRCCSEKYNKISGVEKQGLQQKLLRQKKKKRKRKTVFHQLKTVSPLQFLHADCPLCKKQESGLPASQTNASMLFLSAASRI